MNKQDMSGSLSLLPEALLLNCMGYCFKEAAAVPQRLRARTSCSDEVSGSGEKNWDRGKETNTRIIM